MIMSHDSKKCFISYMKMTNKLNLISVPTVTQVPRVVNDAVFATIHKFTQR